MPENHQKTRNKGNPGQVGNVPEGGEISCGRLGFAHLDGDERSKETLQQIHEHHGKGGLPAQHTEGVGQACVLGAVVSNVEVLSFREFCDPDCAGDRPQHVRYWKTQ